MERSFLHLAQKKACAAGFNCFRPTYQRIGLPSPREGQGVPTRRSRNRSARGRYTQPRTYGPPAAQAGITGKRNSKASGRDETFPQPEQSLASRKRTVPAHRTSHKTNQVLRVGTYGGPLLALKLPRRCEIIPSRAEHRPHYPPSHQMLSASSLPRAVRHSRRTRRRSKAHGLRLVRVGPRSTFPASDGSQMKRSEINLAGAKRRLRSATLPTATTSPDLVLLHLAKTDAKLRSLEHNR